MTFDDDHLVLRFTGGTKRVKCKDVGLEWPPPEKINVGGFDLKRERYSTITDEQRKGMTHVARGAEYFPVE